MATRVLLGGTLIDGTGKDPLPDAAVVICDHKIEQVGHSAQVKYDRSPAEIVDLAGKTLVPGLIDMHVHLSSVPRGLQPGKPTLIGDAPSETLVALAGAQNARAALLGGVTTVRDLGSPFLTNIKLRDLVQAGFIPGPRIVACGSMISMTGGHGGDFALEVDSPDEARKAARQMIKAGADVVKLAASGLTLNSPELTAAEMRAAVEAAHDAGIKVAAHASVWRGVENALAAGVDTIEHGYTLNEAFVETMLKQGTMVVPTLATVRRIARIGADFEGWKDRLDVIHHRLDTAMNSFQLAYGAGVKFALGTDASSPPLLSVGEVGPEFETLVEIGLSKMEALQAATSVAAEGLGWQDRLGTIEAGKLADITVLNGNPLEDLDALGDIYMVIKDGATVVADGMITRKGV